MDFIFDQFVELKSDDGGVRFVPMSKICCVEVSDVDKCNVLTDTGAYICDVQMPARVLVEKIAQRRRSMQYEFFANTYRVTAKK